MKSMLSVWKLKNQQIEDLEYSEYINCPVTNETIFSINSNNQNDYFISHGQCVVCNEYISINGLKTAEGIHRSSWPVRYVGLTCKPCFKNLSM
jgi:hypothetical protein